MSKSELCEARDVATEHAQREIYLYEYVGSYTAVVNDELLFASTRVSHGCRLRIGKYICHLAVGVCSQNLVFRVFLRYYAFVSEVHPLKCKLEGFCAGAHRLPMECFWWVMLLLVGPTSPRPTRTHPPIHPNPSSHYTRFFAEAHRLLVNMMPRLLLGPSHIEERSTQWLNAVSSLAT